MDYGELKGKDQGAWFHVHIYEDYVVKTPRKKNIKDKRLAEIAEIQTYLSERMEEVLPCWKVGGSLVMPRAPGVRADEFNEDKRKYIRKKFKAAVNKMKELGYKYQDSMRTNVFYDVEHDRIFLVDFHSIQSLPGKGGK